MARNYRKEYQQYHGTPEHIAERSQRNKARRAAVKVGKARKGDGKDIDHKVPISKGGTNAQSNLRSMSKSANRGFKRNSKNRPV